MVQPVNGQIAHSSAASGTRVGQPYQVEVGRKLLHLLVQLGELGVLEGVPVECLQHDTAVVGRPSLADTGLHDDFLAVLVIELGLWSAGLVVGEGNGIDIRLRNYHHQIAAVGNPRRTVLHDFPLDGSCRKVNVCISLLPEAVGILLHFVGLGTAVPCDAEEALKATGNNVGCLDDGTTLLVNNQVNLLRGGVEGKGQVIDSVLFNGLNKVVCGISLPPIVVNNHLESNLRIFGQRHALSFP